MTEEELHGCLQRLKEGDKDAFTALHDSIRHQVYGTVCLLVDRQGDVADVVNEIYIELFRSLPQYDRNRPFGAWLNGMIVRQCSNWSRRSWRRLRIQIRSRENATELLLPGADTPLLEQEQRGELLQLVAGLPLNCAVLLSFATMGNAALTRLPLPWRYRWVPLNPGITRQCANCGSMPYSQRKMR